MGDRRLFPFARYPSRIVPASFVLGLAAAASWGGADFIGGVQARHVPALTVVLWGQLAGAVVLVPTLAVEAPHVVSTAVWWGVAAGATAILSLVVFYRALAEGTMSIVAPLSACGAILPVIVSFIRGQAPSVVATVGMTIAIAGVVLVSRSSTKVGSPVGGERTGGGSSDRRMIGMALVSAVGFGLFYVLANQGFSTPGASPLWVLAGAKAGGLVVLGAAVAGSGHWAPWPGRRAWAIAGGGVMDTIATIFLGYAFTRGNLGVVSVLAAQYPVATVVLARLVLAERISRSQAAGVALALVGLALLAAG